MFDTKKAINKIIGNKKYGGKNDLDGDGVINKDDCQPRNTMRQDENKRWCVEFGDGGPVLEIYSFSKSRDKVIMDAREQIKNSNSDIRRFANGRIVRAYIMRKGEVCKKMFN